MTSTDVDYADPHFAIQNDAERYFWIVYHVLVLLSSLLGDSLILFASFQKDAFKLNSLIVVVIQYIAVFDIASTVVLTIPTTLSLIANSQVLSGALCGIQECLSVLIAVIISWLTPILTTSKFLLIKYPLRSASWTTKKRANTICWLSFIPSALITTTKLIIDADDTSFDFRVYECAYSYTANIWKTLMPILAFFALVLPNSILIATTIPTLKYLYTATKSARRVQGSIPWQGAVTVSLTAIVYCISFLPLSIYYIGAPFVKTRFFEVHFYRVTDFLISIGIMSNIYIYVLTIKSFRRFLLSRILAFDLANTMTRSHDGGPTSGKTLFLVWELTYTSYHKPHYLNTRI